MSTTTEAPSAAVLRSVRSVLLDFDGPVCAIFAGLPAEQVAVDLAGLLAADGIAVPAHVTSHDDPLDVLRYAGTLSQEAADQVEAALRDAELRAADTAEPTAGAAEFLSACRATERPVVIVSNNSAPAVSRYLERVGLAPLVSHIAGRVPGRPSLMKPHPELLHQALSAIAAEPITSLLVGDSVTDVQAAQAARVRSVGYANKPGKDDRLRRAGADAVVGSMRDLAAVTASTPRP